MSIAILVCTGLELVSALHVGKTNYSPQKGYNATDNCFVKNFFTVNVTSGELLYGLSAGLDIIGVVGAALSTVNVTVLEVAVLPTSQGSTITLTVKGYNFITILEYELI